jgi:hypothetical protein
MNIKKKCNAFFKKLVFLTQNLINFGCLNIIILQLNPSKFNDKLPKFQKYNTANPLFYKNGIKMKNAKSTIPGLKATFNSSKPPIRRIFGHLTTNNHSRVVALALPLPKKLNWISIIMA